MDRHREPDHRGSHRDRTAIPRWYVMADAASWAVAVVGAALLRVDFELSQLPLVGLSVAAGVATASHLVASRATGLYAGRWRRGSFDEVAALARTAVLATVVLFLLDAVSGRPRWVPLAATVGGGVLALVLTGGVRYADRLVAERRSRPSGEGLARVLVFGAGESGVQVVTSMLRDPTSPYLPVALLDDDPARRRLSIMGVPVIGTREDIAAAARQLGASILLVAIARADRDLLADLTDRAAAAGLALKVLPSTRELLDGVARLSDIRDIVPADLLGRREIDIRADHVAEYLVGKRVLVTGAGGSIGSELCRQIRRLGPAQLVMLDRDESALHAVQLSLDGHGLLDDPGLVLCDIRDDASLRGVFERWHPEVVFHAAALKHLPLLERHPREAVLTNVRATAVLLELARDMDVERFVNVSTDKAADPVSVLGYSKRVAERLTSRVARDSMGVFLSVRFGNVLGSRGSVLQTFTAQIAAGGPITVTHPDASRYFMTTAEAVALLIQAGGIGGRGEVLVLDMGERVRIAEVARRLASAAQHPIDVVFTGLRPGEKLAEVLFGQGEHDVRPNHPLIAQVPVPPLDLAWVDVLLGADDPVGVLSLAATAPAALDPAAVGS